MKKYLLTTLLILALGMTLAACGETETTSTENVTTNTETTAETTTDETTLPTDGATTSSSNTTQDMTANTYEGIDFNSTLPGKEWVQTTFPGVINEPKIVIFNDETNRKTIVENSELVVYNEGDTFAMYMPEGVTLYKGSNLVSTYTEYNDEPFLEIEFDMEDLTYEEQGWKKKYGGARYKVILGDINGIQYELSCIISLSE